MSVKIVLPWSFQQLAEGKEVIEVTGNTVGECLNQLVTRYPGLKKMLFDEDGRLLTYIGIYVNWEDTYPEDAAKTVKDGDEIDILSIIGGG